MKQTWETPAENQERVLRLDTVKMRKGWSDLLLKSAPGINNGYDYGVFPLKFSEGVQEFIIYGGLEQFPKKMTRTYLCSSTLENFADT